MLLVIAVILIIAIILFKKNAKVVTPKKYTSPPKTVKLNRHSFPNNIIENNLSEIIKSFIPCDQAQKIHFQSAEFEDKNTFETLTAEFYVTNILHSSWNDIKELYRIKISKNKNSTVWVLKELRLLQSDDLGKLIPSISDSLFNPFAMPRNWCSQKQKWNSLQKQWDVSWSDSPHYNKLVY